MPRKSPTLLSRDQDTLLRSELLRLAAELQPITVRGLYYKAVVSSLISFIRKDSLGSTTNYDLVQRRVLDLHKSAELAWEWIVDESRSSYAKPRWNNPAGFAETAPWFYRLDFWREQQTRPLVLVEKAGQIPVYLQHAQGLGVDVAACKGYGSASYLRSVALSVEEHIRERQAIQLLVCADFDPSGDDWPRAALQEIQSHVSNPDLITMDRVLVTRDDMEGFGAQMALRGAMPNKGRPLVDRHAPKNGVGWLMNDQQGKACSFTNDSPTAHAQWVIVETRPLRGGGQPVIRRMLRHNAIEAWEIMQKSGGWQRCQPRW